MGIYGLVGFTSHPTITHPGMRVCRAVISLDGCSSTLWNISGLSELTPPPHGYRSRYLLVPVPVLNCSANGVGRGSIRIICHDYEKVLARRLVGGPFFLSSIPNPILASTRTYTSRFFELVAKKANRCQHFILSWISRSMRFSFGPTNYIKYDWIRTHNDGQVICQCLKFTDLFTRKLSWLCWGWDWLKRFYGLRWTFTIWWSRWIHEYALFYGI